MSEQMAAAWARFDRALSKLSRKGIALAPGASPTQLKEFEDDSGLVLPEAVRAFWTTHNGEQPRDAGLAAGFCLLSLTEARKVLKDWAEVRESLGRDLMAMDRDSSSHPRNAIQRKYSLPGWVPLLKDHEGNYVGVDLDPGPAGTVGQVINFGRDEEDKFVLFPSVVELINWLAQELEAGRIYYDEEDGVVRHAEGRLPAAVPTNCW